MRDMLWLPRLDQLTADVAVLKLDGHTEFGFPCVKSYSATVFPVMLSMLCWQQVRAWHSRLSWAVVLLRCAHCVCSVSNRCVRRMALRFYLVYYFQVAGSSLCLLPVCILAWHHLLPSPRARSLRSARVVYGSWYVDVVLRARMSLSIGSATQICFVDW